jgi:hypothetical protein
MQTVTALLEGKGDVRHIDPADPNRSLPGADARDVIGEVSLHKLKAEEAQLAAEARRSDGETQRLENSTERKGSRAPYEAKRARGAQVSTYRPAAATHYCGAQPRRDEKSL